MDHPYTENDTEAFSRDPEGHYFDRKSARKDTGEIAKHLMAFANAAGGKLVVGIEDDGAVTGFKRDKAHSIESFEQAHVTELTPSPRVEAERIPVVNVEGESDQVLVMDVACSENQVVRQRKDGKVALRQGDKSVWLDYGQIRALEYDKGEYYFDGELTRDLTLEDVDHEALQTYKDALGTAISDEKLLRSKGLLKDGRLTNAGAMLFAEAPSLSLPQTKFRVLKIDGIEMGHGDGLRVVKERTFEGPLVRTLPEARDFIASQLREYQFQLPGRMEFTTVPEYPRYPWFEGLVNAIAHRDYTIRGERIRVYIFDDRMEIQSPGGLPNLVTPENMRYTRYSRNPSITNVFMAFDWVRELNEGVDKIYDEMERAGLPDPEYQIREDGYYVKLTLRNNLEERIPRLRNAVAHGNLAGDAIEPDALQHGVQVPVDLPTLMTLSGNEIAAIRLAAENGIVTTKGLAENRGITTRTASSVLKGLASRDILTWRGTSPRDPKQYYEITPKEIS